MKVQEVGSGSATESGEDDVDIHSLRLSAGGVCARKTRRNFEEGGLS